METFFNYIIESGISLGVFTLIYWLLLRKEVMLKASRVYLLIAVLFSTLLPFITINIKGFHSAGVAVIQGAEKAPASNLIETITVYAAGFPAKVGHAVISVKPSVWFYAIGATLALIIIMVGIVQLFSMVSHNRNFRLRLARLVITRKTISPYSFFNFIFINRELPEQENWKAMIYHELEHVKQGHSFDVLFIDSMMVFQWFNPFYWIIRRLVRENHEFLADRAVIQHGHISAGKYKVLLLSQAIGGRTVMTSNFFSVKTIQTRNFGFLKYSVGVVVALTISLCFAVTNTSTAVDRVPETVSPLILDEAVVAPETAQHSVSGTEQQPIVIAAVAKTFSSTNADESKETARIAEELQEYLDSST